MKLRTQIGIGKAAISFQKVTAGCVVQGIPNICPSTQLGAFCIHPICTHPSLFCFTLFSLFFFCLFNRINFDRHSSQSDDAHRLMLKSLAFLRGFSQRPSLKKGLGQNWSILRPYTGTVTNQSQHLQLLSTKQKFTNVSPSLLLYSNGHSLSGQLIVSVHFFQKWMTPKGEL